MATKYKTRNYRVVLLKMELKSFQWADGYYIVVDTNMKDKTYHLCQLNDDGVPVRFTDGTFMTTITGLRNKGVIKTNLIYVEKYV
jgi:hypothetical protein